MRGKDSGSEHERDTAWARSEADADGSATAPATPPPSFGQTPPSGHGRAEPDEDSAWAPDAARAAGEGDPWTSPAVPYPTRYGFQGGLRAQGGYDDDDDPENTNRFRAIPASDTPPAEGGGVPAHGAHLVPPGAQPGPHGGHLVPPGAQPGPHGGHLVPPGAQPGPHGGHPVPPGPHPGAHGGHPVPPGPHPGAHGGHPVPPGPLNPSGPEPVPPGTHPLPPGGHPGSQAGPQPGTQYGPYGAHPLPPGAQPGPPAPQHGMPGIQHVPPGPQPDAGALPAPRRPRDAEENLGRPVPGGPYTGPHPGPQPDPGAGPYAGGPAAPHPAPHSEPGFGWVPRQPASGPDLPPWQQGGDPPSWQPPAQGGPPAWQPPAQGGPTPWQPPVQGGPPAWQPPAQGGGSPGWQGAAHPGPVPPQQNPGASEWQSPEGAEPPSSSQPPQEPQAPWWRQVGPDGTQAYPPEGSRSDEPSPGVPSFAAWTPDPVEGQSAEDARWVPGDPGQPGAQSVPSQSAEPRQAQQAEPARDVGGGAAPVPSSSPDSTAAPDTPVSAQPGDALRAPASGEPGDAYGEAHASSAASIRPGEPGDVPVWPPRLPGEPDTQGEGRAGSSWPPSSVYRGTHESGPSGAVGNDNDQSGDRSGGNGPTGASPVPGRPGIPGDQAAPSGELSGRAGRHSGTGGANDQHYAASPSGLADRTDGWAGDASGELSVPSDQHHDAGASDAPGRTDGPADGTAGDAASAAGALTGDPGSGPTPHLQGAGDRPSSQDRDDAGRDEAGGDESGRNEAGGNASSPYDALPPGATEPYDALPPTTAADDGAGAASGPYALPAGPPAGFGAEIGQAVTPIEGFPMPGGPYEPGQQAAHAGGQHGAHHDQGGPGPYGGPPPSPQEGTWPVPPPSPEGPYTTTSQPPGQAPNHLPGQIPGLLPGQILNLPPGYAPSGTSPGDAPPAAPDPGTAPYDAPPVSPSETDDAQRAASPDTDSGQMPTTSPTTGSSTQPNGETPFAFTPVTPASAGRPAPPPGFGPPPAAPGSNLPATLGSATPPPQGGKVKRILMAAGAVVVVGAIGTAAYFAYAGEPESGPQPRTSPVGAAPSPAAPQPSAAVASTILDTEQTDPRTLKPGEAFPDEKVTLDGRTYRRVKVDVTDDCGKAAAGAFATALTDQQCRRVLRATYVDGKRDYAVTAGIAVLPSKVAALAVDREKNLGANVWFRGLNGTQASGADKVTISGGYAAGMVWGRYIVFSYATYADGHTPDAKDTGLGQISGAFRDHMTKVIQKRATR
ncbi:hypothetical protein F5972_03050 [Microbispora cellulosiformans]|uniref:Uncharacterized protein n=1 Tax=Microbispora cellulosiformans TaxID=2614688 RepID=A0A5J5KCV2_9ACTN|nr:hypothetical protein [Microbispora cellulosiformans]KAA9381809.1 hypothetical protein F5972_03050 [Microbispora cellulosiformans]